mgnify:CR=1 FL=1
MRHYQAGKNPKPPATVDHDGLPYKDAVKQLADIKKALEADTEWLAKIITCEDPGDPSPEWSGYMNHLAREGGFISKATYYVYGPLIDAPPSHPDTILTIITSIEEFMQYYGKKYIHLVADLQLYKVAIQLKWSDLTRWNYHNETRRYAHPDVISGLHRELDEGYWPGGASKCCLQGCK